MQFRWHEDQERFRQDVRAFIDSELPADWDQQPPDEGYSEVRHTVALQFQKAMADRQWLTMAWPEENGGLGASYWQQMVLNEEMGYRRAPSSNMGVMWVGPALMLYGTDDQKSRHLSAIAEAEDDSWWCTLYSEPGAGSDLASLQTRAVKDGDDYVINGQKIWTSGAHRADWGWLAARTDPDAPKHRGMTMFLLDMHTPGVTVQPLINMSDGHGFNEVFFEDVRIPADSLVGEQNRGWYTVANALDFERVSLAPTGGLAVQFDRALDYFKKERPAQLKEGGTRQRLADLKVDLHILRALNIVNASIIANEETPTMEASMTKIWSSELRYRLSSMNMDLMGRYGGLSHDDEGLAPVEAQNEQAYRASPILRFGGGTNEVQRSIIAQRGFGLPR
jgi:alkylation response protein AidB-like acyl-CoA dehydrogenase